MFARFQARFITSAAKIASVSQPINRIITVEWTDGMKGKFPVIWLRDCSPDPVTYSVGPAMVARNLTMNEFDVEQSPKDVRLENDELVIDWEDTQSRFDSTWLRIRNPSDEKAADLRRRVYLFPERTWGKDEIESRLKKFDHDAVMNDDKVTHKVFEVSTKPDASNKAYASDGGLPFHTDFPSLSHPPQLQMLHMVQRAEEGGNSLFVDGFHVAEQLRREKPEVFNILTKYSLEFIEEGFDVHDGPDGKPKKFDYNMCARHRTIKLDERGRVIKIQFGNAMRSWFYDCNPEEIQDIYRCDTVLWANTRLLHTRDAFRNASNGSRTLTGCYFAWDIVKSRVRFLRRKLGLPSAQPSA
ncbi:putative gamma-butyrobetaine dioxygenase [Ancylostoma ceylanicum]|uniref:Putative gamma-butyrobetaine dioxygenase n=1 Tax=Ancylostoma ceylanicum TaxID=53326 RepID=A0A0D6M0S2_9BILA|nr:putative gamma-butyrobetaine dioxygenase [Ancylostoma ceylanicum]